jgi:hypothetical protein
VSLIRRNSFLCFVLFLLTGTLLGQSQAPRDLDKLASRATQYWQSLGSGQRVKAAAFVISNKKDEFLAAGAVPFVQPRIIGIDFTAETGRAVVRTAVKLIPTAGVTGMTDWVVNDTWVWIGGNWFLEILPAQNPFQSAGQPRVAPSSESVRLLEQNFRIVNETVNVGTIWQGENPLVNVGIEYKGDLPIRIESSLNTSLIALDAMSTRQIQPGTSNFNLRIYTEEYEGPFRMPFPLTVYYKDVEIKKTVTVEGVVFAPFTFRQVPDPASLNPGEKFEVYVRNNMDSAVAVDFVQTEAAFDVVEHARQIPPQAEGKIVLVRRPDAETLPARLAISVTKPIQGKQLFYFKVRRRTGP